MFTLSKSLQLKKDLKLVDKYIPQKVLAKMVGVSINTMIKLRKQAGLGERPKGRPYSKVTFKGEEQYPKEVQEALERMPALMEFVRFKGTEEIVDIEEEINLQELEVEDRMKEVVKQIEKEESES